MRKLVFVALFGVFAAGCGSSAQSGARDPAHAPNAGPIAPTQIPQGQFGPKAHQVLLDPTPSVERTNLLAGVVRRQLERARQRFEAGKPEAGLAAVTGALYLLRAGELHLQMVEGNAPALRWAAREVARVGDEGRALALYGMLRSVLPEGRLRADVEAHVANLNRWASEDAERGPMQAAGSDQRLAVQRALLEPTEQALIAAREATISWVQRAVDSKAAELAASGEDTREAFEAFRAMRSAGFVLVALHLRHGDPGGALTAIDNADLGRLLAPGLRDRLERAAEADDPRAWLDLFRIFHSASQGQGEGDPELARAAAWGAALGLYRSEPGAIQAAIPLAQQLVELGIAEAAAVVLASTVADDTGPQELSAALSLVLHGMLAEEDAGQLASSRSVLEHAAPILAAASSAKLARLVRPTPARLRFVMGALETRAGEIERARPHIEAAARNEPTQAAFSLLAAIDRQRGDDQAAARSLEQVLALARSSRDTAGEAEALLGMFELYRDQGNGPKAAEALRGALDRVLAARQAAQADGDKARTERLLARVLEHYGADRAARRATERAFEASSSDVHQLTATVLDATRRALTHEDLMAARDAVQRGVEGGLEDEDLIYAALWLQLLERQMKVISDGTAEEAYAAIEDSTGWAAKLKAWARGKLDNEQLLKAAKSPIEQTEAKFYAVMSRRAEGGAAAKKSLAEIAGSKAIELVEVTIARDLLALERGVRFEVPDNVELP